MGGNPNPPQSAGTPMLQQRRSELCWALAGTLIIPFPHPAAGLQEMQTRCLSLGLPLVFLMLLANSIPAEAVKLEGDQSLTRRTLE